MSASARLSLRGQLALHAAAIGVVTTALALAAILPLWWISRQEGPAAILEQAELALVLVIGAALIVFAVSYLLLMRWIAGPAERLLVATERVGMDLDAPLLAESGPALGRLGTAFARMEIRLQEERQRVRSQLAELQEMNRELSAARDQAIRQEKLATVGRLAAGVAHEVGNPLSACFGYLELLKADAEGAPEYTERLQRELKRIDRIVRDLLDYARPREPELRPLELAAVVEEALRLAKPQSRFAGIRFDVMDEAPGVVARGDEHYLVQALVNLLQNAADAMDGKGVIRIAIRRLEDGAAMIVADEGPGIPAADLPRIFDPFFSTKSPGKGTGLGLSLCHGWIEAMGGRLRAANGADRGAELRIELMLESPGE